MRFAIGTGGKFTDLLIEDQGKLCLIPSPTGLNNSVGGALGAFMVAAEMCNMDHRHSLANGEQFARGKTCAIHAIVTKRVAQPARFVAKGHPDIRFHPRGWSPDQGEER
jgi:N-methylhydantoinase A